METSTGSGKVELGGWKKTFGRVPPRFMTEEMCHRNMAWTLYQADEMPLMRMGETKVEKLGHLLAGADLAPEATGAGDAATPATEDMDA